MAYDYPYVGSRRQRTSGRMDLCEKIAAVLGLCLLLRRPRSFEQNFRVDMWNVCRGYAATRNGSFVK